MPRGKAGVNDTPVANRCVVHGRHAFRTDDASKRNPAQIPSKIDLDVG
jgi:hypothetical protein